MRQTRNRRGDLYRWYRELYNTKFDPAAFDVAEVNAELEELRQRQEP